MRTSLTLAVILVLAWRNTTLLLAEIDALKVALALVGITFLAAGLATRLTLDSRAARIFVWYAVCQALHWGGPLPLPESSLESVDWKLLSDLFYFVVAVVGAQCLLVLLACELSDLAWTRDRRVYWLMAPVGLALTVAGASWLDIEGARPALMATYALANYGLGVAALIIIARSARRLRGGVLLFASIGIPAAVGIVAAPLGYTSEWLNLLYVFEAPAFAYVIRVHPD